MKTEYCRVIEKSVPYYSVHFMRRTCHVCQWHTTIEMSLSFLLASLPTPERILYLMVTKELEWSNPLLSFILLYIQTTPGSCVSFSTLPPVWPSFVFSSLLDVISPQYFRQTVYNQISITELVPEGLALK